ncbi:DUF3509 domain-containing protein [Pseudomonas cavernae]|uniref:DUF3509 domain-containing protein n=1 Tax=Pseudomonas cavernae TaxID=2320867 RepID=A0A385Z0U8_9PSED|nr:DUF3509 domain-containing protein [Pseudomonas cavernae]AYC31847.1 DUF3509 domain-containing protein [Pseudomonas cavernae]
MDNPFQRLTAAFHRQYRVNFCVERPDGSIMLTLSNDRGLVAKRLISPAQRNDPQRLRLLIASVRFGIVAEHHPAPRKIRAATRAASAATR